MKATGSTPWILAKLAQITWGDALNAKSYQIKKGSIAQPVIRDLLSTSPLILFIIVFHATLQCLIAYNAVAQPNVRSAL